VVFSYGQSGTIKLEIEKAPAMRRGFLSLTQFVPITRLLAIF
jgi:hypothetical protein